ncbi:hypothetical protein [Bremerella cremea]|uniref:hypothetical protein n=1 Tax=Bremerella cremea TaxID=1031537 RepID=UPI0031E8ADE1
MTGSWIKLHRKSLDSRVFSDANLWRLFTLCLLRANFRPGYFQGELVEAGQFITTQRALAEELGCSRTSLIRWMSILEEWECLKVDYLTQTTRVTVENYPLYQELDPTWEPTAVPASEPPGVPPTVPRGVPAAVPPSEPRGVPEVVPIEEEREEQEQQEEPEETKAPAGPLLSCRGEGEKAPPARARRATFDATTLPMPFAGEPFRQAWTQWCEHRLERRMPLHARSAQKQLQQLEQLGEAQALAAIEHSLTAGYLGIFEPPRQANVPRGSGELKSVAELLADRTFD